MGRRGAGRSRPSHRDRGNWMLNVERGAAGECRLINLQAQASGEMTEGSDQVSEVACNHRPDESGKSPMRPPKSSLIGGGRVIRANH
jgi:hypothetical protein